MITSWNPDRKAWMVTWKQMTSEFRYTSSWSKFKALKILRSSYNLSPTLTSQVSIGKVARTIMELEVVYHTFGRYMNVSLNKIHHLSLSMCHWKHLLKSHRTMRELKGRRTISSINWIIKKRWKIWISWKITTTSKKLKTLWIKVLLTPAHCRTQTTTRPSLERYSRLIILKFR